MRLGRRRQRGASIEGSLRLRPARQGSGRRDQCVAQPTLVRLALEAAVGAIDAAGKYELGTLLGAGLDVAAVDADRRRPEETMRLRGLEIGNIDPANGCVETELSYDPLDQLERGLRVRAALERQDFDDRLRHDSSSVWQQAATCSALSASRASPTSSSINTRSSATKLKTVRCSRRVETNPHQRKQAKWLDTPG